MLRSIELSEIDIGGKLPGLLEDPSFLSLAHKQRLPGSLHCRHKPLTPQPICRVTPPQGIPPAIFFTSGLERNIRKVFFPL